jgi:hypothetical protein
VDLFRLSSVKGFVVGRPQHLCTLLHAIVNCRDQTKDEDRAGKLIAILPVRFRQLFRHLYHQQYAKYFGACAQINGGTSVRLEY